MKNILEQSFEDFFSEEFTAIPIPDVVLALVVGAVLSFFIRWYYLRYGRSVSNRKILANNFMSITLTTTLIITIVKSSLALSLGLVGALSIVRFRTAIKEPEELAFLFLSISVGLGLGAGQMALTVISLLIILGLLAIQNRFKRTNQRENLFINVTVPAKENLSVKDVSDVLGEYCKRLELRRVDDTSKELEVSFLVEYAGLESLDKSIRALKSKYGATSVTIVETIGLI